jgi:hypothetical protein
VAQSGLKSIAQGLPWVSQNKRSALKGLECALDSLRGSGPIFAVPDGPFRANARGKLTQGKPCAKLSCPLRGEASSLCVVHEHKGTLHYNLDVESALLSDTGWKPMLH